MSRHQATARRLREDYHHAEFEKIARIAAFLPPPDPFNLDGACTSPGGHMPILSGKDLVCVHCERIFWSER